MKYFIMKNTFIILLLAFAFISLSAQNDYRARLPIYGGFEQIGVSPSGEVWIATKAGNTYYTKNINQMWHFGPFGSKDPYSMGISSGTFERISFFSEDIMMISGFIHGSNSMQNFVYRSEDHGENWQKVIFGKSSWIDAACVSTDGKAWMSGSSQLIYYTEDFGVAWQEFDKVEKMGNLRFNSVHFAKDGLHGLFGSTWNVIYKTTDNCKTWKKILTPLDQKKYSQLVGSNNDRPEIKRIKITENNYIVNQKGHVFYTNQNEIDWIEIPEAFDFEVTECGNIYIVNKDRTVSLLDPEFNLIWKSKEHFDQFPVISMKNEDLYAVTYNSVYKVNTDEFVKNDLFTDEVPISEPYMNVEYRGEKVGFEHNDILKYDKDTQHWYRYMTLNESVVNAVVYKDELIISCTTQENMYSVNLNTKQLTGFKLPDKLFNLMENPILSVSIERGSQGCFHHELEKTGYKYKNGDWVSDKSPKEKSLGLAKKIPSEELINILNEIENYRNIQLSINDLDISEKDIKDYKSLIAQKEKKMKDNEHNMPDFEDIYTFPGNNKGVDFEFYRNMVDSIKNLPDSVINTIYSQNYGNWSTTTDWRKIVFKFRNSESLIIYNQDDKPNYFYTPWTINYNGIIFHCSSFTLSRLIDKLSEGKLLPNREACEKKYAIFKIVDYLYRQSIDYPPL